MIGVKKMRYRNRRRRTILLGVLALVGFMSIGYALLATNLRITGTSNITSTFNVYIKSITTKALHNANTIKASVGSNKLTANFEVGLEAPGSYAEYEVVVANDSTFPIELMSIDGIYKANQKAPTSITFSTDDIVTGEVLEAGEEKAFIVRVDFDIDATSLPTQNKQLTLTLNYEQTDSSGTTYPQQLDFQAFSNATEAVISGADKLAPVNSSGTTASMIGGKLTTGVFRAGHSYRVDVELHYGTFHTAMTGQLGLRTGSGTYDYTAVSGSWKESGNIYSYEFTVPSTTPLMNNTGEFVLGVGGAYFEWSTRPSAAIATISVIQLS